MRKVVIGVDQLFDPRITIEHHHAEPRARLRIARNVEIVLPMSEFDKWLGNTALEVGQAARDVQAIVNDIPNVPYVSEPA